VHLEQEVAQGRIMRYGISSNTFATSTAATAAGKVPHNIISLEKCLQIAKSSTLYAQQTKASFEVLMLTIIVVFSLFFLKTVSNDHHFECVQFPMNLHETEAYTGKFYANGTLSLLEYAKVCQVVLLLCASSCFFYPRFFPAFFSPCYFGIIGQ